MILAYCLLGALVLVGLGATALLALVGWIAQDDGDGW